MIGLDVDQEIGAPSRIGAGMSGGSSLTRTAFSERNFLLGDLHGNVAHNLAKALLVLLAERVVREGGEIIEIVLFG